MRLSTLARQIRIKPSKLVDFLDKQGIELNNGVNTRLDVAAITMIKEHFEMDEPEDELESVELQEKEDILDQIQSVSDENPDQEIPTDEVESAAHKIVKEPNALTPGSEEPINIPKSGTVDDLEMGEAEKIELIKAKKIKLEGIKVIGKIELPEKEKKQERTGKKTEKAEQPERKPKKPTQKDRTVFDRKKGAGSYSSRQNLSYEEKLKIEEKKKRKIQLQKAKVEKERKRKHYIEKVQPKTTNKTVKSRKKLKHTQQEAEASLPVNPNPIRRFWDWLNGRYDR